MGTRPNLEYTGQATSEILAHVDTQSDFSLLRGLEWGIQAKARALGGEDKLTDEERLVLAVLALEREVNNGGYRQFFWNSSRRFTPTIVASLYRIDCERTAVLTAKAITALGLSAVTVQAVEEEIQRENEARNAQLTMYDREFYTFNETTEKLLRFAMVERAKIQVPRTDDYPRIPTKTPRAPKDSLFRSLTVRALVEKGKWRPGFEEARTAAREAATDREVAATEADIEAAATLFAFQQAVRRKDLEAAASLAGPSQELMGTNGFHVIENRKWVEELIAAGLVEEADAASLNYLHWLSGRKLDAEKAAKKVLFWAGLVRENRNVLSNSARYFVEHCPEVDLDNLPAPRLILPAKELYAKMKPPQIEVGDE
jgi:uncharacterized protein DUF4375